MMYQRWKKQRNRRRRLRAANGSMTVELSLLMPLLLAVFILLIYLAAFLYNRETAQAIACIGIHKGLQMEHDSGAAVQKKVETYVREELSQRLVLSPRADCQIEAGMTRIRVSIALRQDIPLAGLSGLLRSDRGFQTKIVRKAGRIDPTDLMWGMKR